MLDGFMFDLDWQASRALTTYGGLNIGYHFPCIERVDANVCFCS